MERYVYSTSSELRRSDRATKPVTSLTYRHLTVQDIKNTERYDQQTEILISIIIDNINHQWYEKRKKTHKNSFVETYTISQVIKKFLTKGRGLTFR